MRNYLILLLLILISSCKVLHNKPGHGNLFDESNIPTEEEYNEDYKEYSEEEIREALLNKEYFDLHYGDFEGTDAIVVDTNELDIESILEEYHNNPVNDSMIVFNLEDYEVFEEEELLVKPTLEMMEEAEIPAMSMMKESEEEVMMEEVMMIEHEEHEELLLESSSITPIVQEEEVIREKEKGLMVHNIPNEMKVGEMNRVELRITRSAYFSEFEIGMKDANETTTIRTSSRMSVELFDASPDSENPHFLVNAVNKKPLQFVEGGKATTYWEWDVLPLKAGKSSLNLVIHIVTENGDQYIPVFEGDIEVESNLPWSIKRFMREEWEWIAGSLALPLLGYIWKVIIVPFWRRRKEEEE